MISFAILLPGLPNVEVQWRAAQRTVRCMPLLGGMSRSVPAITA
jgi:hypothetical protein